MINLFSKQEYNQGKTKLTSIDQNDQMQIEPTDSKDSSCIVVYYDCRQDILTAVDTLDTTKPLATLKNCLVPQDPYGIEISKCMEATLIRLDGSNLLMLVGLVNPPLKHISKILSFDRRRGFKLIETSINQIGPYDNFNFFISPQPLPVSNEKRKLLAVPNPDRDIAFSLKSYSNDFFTPRQTVCKLVKNVRLCCEPLTFHPLHQGPLVTAMDILQLSGTYAAALDCNSRIRIIDLETNELTMFRTYTDVIEKENVHIYGCKWIEYDTKLLVSTLSTGFFSLIDPYDESVVVVDTRDTHRFYCMAHSKVSPNLVFLAQSHRAKVRLYDVRVEGKKNNFGVLDFGLKQREIDKIWQMDCHPSDPNKLLVNTFYEISVTDRRSPNAKTLVYEHLRSCTTAVFM